jgi:hypothetical protein
MTAPGTPLAYPIVTLGEVLNYPEETVVRIRKATLNIQKTATKSTSALLQHMVVRAHALEVALERFQARYTELQAQRHTESQAFLRELDKFQAKQQRGILSEADQVKMKRIVDHLRGLNRVCAELLAFVGSFEAMAAEIDAAVAKSHDAYWTLFLIVQSHAFATDVIPLKRVTAWDLPATLEGLPIESYASALVEDSSPQAAELRRVLAGMSA